MSHVFVSHHRLGFWIRSLKLENHNFDLMALTFDLERQTWMRFHQCQSLYQILCPYAKQFGSESPYELLELTDRWKDENTELILYLNH